MEYISVSEAAKVWNLSERSVRDYCAQKRVPGAFLAGKTWNIPADAPKPHRRKKTVDGSRKNLLEVLREEKNKRINGGIYHKIQIDLTYNSNRIEGSKLTSDETRYIYETHTINAMKDKSINVDDIVETVNHFRCVDRIIEVANYPLSERMIKELHLILKSGTADSRKSWFEVGDYKTMPNEVGGIETTAPANVAKALAKLLDKYNRRKVNTFEDILAFHVAFERIHPFQDGNGRVGRLIMFKECLKNNLAPFIIDDKHKLYYYRGLKEWSRQKGYLTDTCLAAQDIFKTHLDYFRIAYRP